MSDYGIDVYYDHGVKLLSTAQMGVAFPLAGSGSFSYSTEPNSVSQVEFPRSPVISGWPASATNESIKQVFDSMPGDWIPAPVWSTISRYRDSAPRVTYSGNHISGCSEPVLGLSNTLNGGKAPAFAAAKDTYGVFAQDSLINLACRLRHLVLVKTEVLRGLAFPPCYWANLTDFSRTPQLLVVPLLTPNTVIAVKAFVFGVSVGLLARTPGYEVYILHCNSSDPSWVSVYTYDTLDVAMANNSKEQSEYGIEVFEGNAVKFSSRYPPLLPVFVSTYPTLNSVPAQGVGLACVFSSISTVVWYKEYDRRSFEEVSILFNGVKWDADGKLSRAMMGFYSKPKRGKSVSGGTLTRMASFDEAFASKRVSSNGQPSPATQGNSGAFMAVVAHH